MSSQSMENRDYKYVMQDISNVYIGAKFSYQELIEEDDTPFKIKKMIHEYIEKEMQEENLSLERHFYYMEAGGFMYQMFLQLKTRVKFNLFSEKKGHYETEIMKLEDFVKIPSEKKEEQKVFIQEIIFSKLALLTL